MIAITITLTIIDIGRSFQDALLDFLYQDISAAGEELDAVFGSLVRAKKTVFGVVAASVYGGGKDLVQTDYQACAGLLEDTAGAAAGVDVAVDDGVCKLKDSLRPVGKDKLHFSSLGADELGVVIYIIYAGEFVDIDSEDLAVALESKNVCVRVDAGLVHPVEIQN